MTNSEIKHQISARVFKGEVFAGTLSRTDKSCIFEYDASYSGGDLAFSLPRSNPKHFVSGSSLHPFFAGLLPEGYRLRALTRYLKTSEDDLMSLLMAVGQDCIGDVSIVHDADANVFSEPALDLSRLNEVSFDDVFQKSLDLSARDADSSIPGIQNKISAGRISFPLKSRKAATRYILKLNSEEFPDLVENEYFFMKLAKTCGLDVAKTEIIHDKDGKSGLLVERFDRHYETKPKRVIKVHQEDACQFLNRYPSEKYRLSYREIADGIQQWCTAPIPNILTLLKWIAYSYLIGNGDLHAKNISIQIHPSTKHVALTPAYDFLSTLPYGDQHLALKFEGKDDGLNRRMFCEFGERYGIHSKAVERMLDQLLTDLNGKLALFETIPLRSPKKATQILAVTKGRMGDLG